MAAPAQFIYTYESRTQLEKPADNATHMSVATRNDPNFLWQNSGQRARAGTVWVRATKRKVTPEYKSYLLAEKAKREAEFDFLSGIIGQMKMSEPNNNKYMKNGYAASLMSGMSLNQIMAAKAQADKLSAEIDAISAMLDMTGMGGGKKRRSTRRKHSKRRQTHRK